MKQVTVEGFTVDAAHNVSGFVEIRFYETDQVFVFPNSVRRPRPNTWRLKCAMPLKVRRGQVTCPDIVLQATTEAGEPEPQLYAHVLVDAAGREYWSEGNEFVLPAVLGPSIHLFDLTVFNLKLRGEWDESEA